MIAKNTIVLTFLLLGIVLSQQPCIEEDPDLLNYVKKGMTFSV